MLTISVACIVDVSFALVHHIVLEVRCPKHTEWPTYNQSPLHNHGLNTRNNSIRYSLLPQYLQYLLGIFDRGIPDAVYACYRLSRSPNHTREITEHMLGRH